MDRVLKSSCGEFNIHVLDQGRPDTPLTILCLHGFTRNSADFHALAGRLSERHRVLVPDQRGRGRSDSDPNPANYQPATYAGDMFALLDQLGIERAAVIGTSMGGIIAMVMAGMQPHRLRGIVLNDIGPDIPASGMQRLRAMLGDRTHPASWDEAAAKTKESFGAEYPYLADEDWLAFARRCYLEEADRPAPAYDPAILTGLDDIDRTAPLASLWPLWPALEPVPVLAIRGALSEIIAADTLALMARRHRRLTAVTVPNVGHAPMLDEPQAVTAIDQFMLDLVKQGAPGTAPEQEKHDAI